MASIARPPQGLHDTVTALLRDHHRARPSSASDEQHPQDPPLARSSETIEEEAEPSQRNSPAHSKQRSPRPSTQHARRWSASTPSGRTGPPRSISYNYSISGSHPASRENSQDDYGELPHINLPERTADFEDPDVTTDFAPATSPFRGALEFSDPEQREKERELAEKRGKKRDSFSYFYDVFNPGKWVAESPRAPHGDPEFLSESPAPGSPIAETSSAARERESHERTSSRTPSQALSPTQSVVSSRFIRRTRSLPHIKNDKDRGKSSAAPKWGRLRSLLPHIAAQGKEQPPPSAVVPQAVNITDELIAGGLSTLLLRLWFERDEKGHRRVPALFHHLRIRISDSLHPLHGNKAVFRIECEYANSSVRWVVYRQLREFLSLHTHYTISNAYNRTVDTLPDFPRAGK